MKKSGNDSSSGAVAHAKQPVGALFTNVVNSLLKLKSPISDGSSSTFFVDKSRLAAGVRRGTSSKISSSELSPYDQSLRALRSEINNAFEIDISGPTLSSDKTKIRKRKPHDCSLSPSQYHISSGQTSRMSSPSRSSTTVSHNTSLVNSPSHTLIEVYPSKVIISTEYCLKPLNLEAAPPHGSSRFTPIIGTLPELSSNMSLREPAFMAANIATTTRFNSSKSQSIRHLTENLRVRVDSLAPLKCRADIGGLDFNPLKRGESIGCHRSVESILARADERNRRQSEASSRKERSDHFELETLCRAIEERSSREDRKIVAKEVKDRRHVWRSVMAIISALQRIGGRLEQQVVAHREAQKTLSAAMVITKFFVTRRVRSHYVLQSHVLKSYKAISVLFSAAVRRWQASRAIERLKDFFLSCLRCTAQGVSAMYVLRFAKAVRRVQGAARQFMARNRARIKTLERTWDAYEYHYISATVKALQKASKSHPPAAFSNNNISGQSTARGAPHNNANTGGGGTGGSGHTALPPLGSSSSSSKSTYIMRMEQLMEQKRSVIDEKIRKHAGFQFEKESLISYQLSKASRTAHLLTVVRDAVLSLRYKESVRLLQMAEAEKTCYYLKDALCLLQAENDPFLLSTAKWKMEAAGDSSRSVYSSNAIATKKKLALLYYDLILEESAVWKCVREAHEKNQTFETIQKDHIGCI